MQEPREETQTFPFLWTLGWRAPTAKVTFTSISEAVETLPTFYREYFVAVMTFPSHSSFWGLSFFLPHVSLHHGHMSLVLPFLIPWYWDHLLYRKDKTSKQKRNQWNWKQEINRGKDGLKSCFFERSTKLMCLGFPGGSDGKESACNAGYLGSILVSGRSPGEGNGNTLQYTCLENPKDEGAWWATVHRVAKSQTQLSDFYFTSQSG